MNQRAVYSEYVTSLPNGEYGGTSRSGSDRSDRFTYLAYRSFDPACIGQEGGEVFSTPVFMVARSHYPGTIRPPAYRAECICEIIAQYTPGQRTPNHPLKVLKSVTENTRHAAQSVHPRIHFFITDLL